MGKSPVAKRLVIWVAPQWEHDPHVDALREKGHEIVPMALSPDLILHPAGWGAWDASMWPYLEVAIKSARERKTARETT